MSTPLYYLKRQNGAVQLHVVKSRKDVEGIPQEDMFTSEGLEQKTNREIVVLYNQIKGGTEILKFKDKETGLRRLKQLMEQKVTKIADPVDTMTDKEILKRRINYPRLDLKKVLVLIQQINPKKKNSKSWSRYEKYRTSHTIDEYLSQGGFPADIKWDINKGFIQIKDPE